MVPVGTTSGPFESNGPPVGAASSGNYNEVDPKLVEDGPVGTDLLTRGRPKMPIQVDIRAAPLARQSAEQEGRHERVGYRFECQLEARWCGEVDVFGETDHFTARRGKPAYAAVKSRHRTRLCAV